jgi:hypothetical protein
MTIKVKEENDGTFTISWDENSPTESIFNTWTEDDFVKAITDYLETLTENDIGGESKDLS